MSKTNKFAKWSPESGEAAVPLCPRCNGAVPNDFQPGAYPGALSRWDNKTEICSNCGTEEAIIQFTEGHAALHPFYGALMWAHQPPR